MKRLTRHLALLLIVLAVALAGANCKTSDVALKAQAGAIDSLKLAGATAKLVAGPMDATCRAGLPKTVGLCDTWYVFVKGKEPANVMCKAPTIGAITDVHSKCGFKVSYKTMVAAYDDNKDIGLAAASVIESIVKQVTGFADHAGGN